MSNVSLVYGCTYLYRRDNTDTWQEFAKWEGRDKAHWESGFACKILHWGTSIKLVFLFFAFQKSRTGTKIRALAHLTVPPQQF